MEHFAGISVFSFGRVARAAAVFLSRRLGVDLDSSSAELGLLLGLGNLNARNLCSGYSHACPCGECKARSENVSPKFRAWLEGDGKKMPPVFRAPKHAVQPWEGRAA